MTTLSNSEDLCGLLKSVFGFAAFRANQEAVCRASIAGRDLLLVMPTGSGKSLCYQLPAIALGGTALVISPLISLMEDQAAKLEALGLRVARIHSGRDRADSRQACIDYLNGSLQFLFIAPERLRVPGFGEMLAKRKPALIAIDEAHCISQWGHDFRPDYRMLGQYLPALRPAPVLALTATATPTVQADIITQLGLSAPEKFIHGFRRDNLAIEVVEVPVPERPGVVCRLLADVARRPAIVYAPSRKLAEKLAEELAGVAASAAYHAGLDAETRERVQRKFQSGELEIVVATIAFGMGIDKADVRTVIHAGLPGTLEGYYQEIGRAGRDGKLSRTFLMHSYADQRTHDFLMSRDYPPVDHLREVFKALTAELRPIEELRAASKLSAEEFDKALEKLEIHGGARCDFGGNATAGGPGWQKTYTIQSQYRAEQFEKVLRFTSSGVCRMAALVMHFGDTEDANQLCGLCDACDPAGAVLRQFRRASVTEREMAGAIIAEFRRSASKGTGALQRSVDPANQLDRRHFDALLEAMVRAGLIEIEDAVFEKDGEVIKFRKVRLADHAGNADEVELLLSDGIASDLAAPNLVGGDKSRRRSQPAPNASTAPESTLELTVDAQTLADRIKAWRKAEAKRLGVPAYLVLNDRTIGALALARPRNPNQLLAVDGIGPAKVDKFGEPLLALIAGT